MRSRKLLAILAILALALAGLTSSCAQKTQSEESLNDWLSQKDFDNKNHPYTAQQLEQIGDNNYKSGLLDQAYADYEKAQEQMPDSIELRVKKGRILLAKKMHEQALMEYKQVLELAPNHTGANEGAGECYFKAGLNDEAQKYFQNAITTSPDSWLAHNYLGIIQSHDKNYQEAIVEYQRALELQPGHQDVLNNLGVAKLMTGDYAGAADMFQKAIRSGSAKSKTYNNLGLALARMGNLNQALEAFICAGDEARAYNNLGYILYLDGKFDLAIHYLELAVNASPAYYERASENLKRVRMARRLEQQGSSLAISPVPAALAVTPAPQTTTPPLAPAAATPAPVAEPAASATVVDPEPAAVVVPGEDEAQKEPTSLPSGKRVKKIKPTAQNNVILPPLFTQEAMATPTPAATPQAENRIARAEPAAPTVRAATRPAPQRNRLAAMLTREPAAITSVSLSGNTDGYAILLSSWRTLSKAWRVSHALNAKGASTFVNKAQISSGTWFRVLTGSYESMSQALSHKAEAARRFHTPSAVVVHINPETPNTLLTSL